MLLVGRCPSQERFVRVSDDDRFCGVWDGPALRVGAEAPGPFESIGGVDQGLELSPVECVPESVRHGADLLAVELLELPGREAAEGGGRDGFELFDREIVGWQASQLLVGHGCDELGGESADLLRLECLDGSGWQFAHLRL